MDDGVARLHARVVKAGVELPLQHRSRAHPGAQGDRHQGLAAHARPGHELPQGGGVGVVLQQSGKAQLPAHQIGQGGVVQLQIVGVEHHSALRVDGAGGGQAYTPGLGNLHPRLLRRQTGGLGDGVGDGLRPPGAGDAGLGQQPPLSVHHTCRHIGAAQVNPHIIHSDSSPFSLHNIIMENHLPWETAPKGLWSL